MAAPMLGTFDLRKARWLLRVLVLVVGLATILQWQRGFMQKDAKLDATQRVTASTGINREQKFFFFLYHLGLFPVATDAPVLE